QNIFARHSPAEEGAFDAAQGERRVVECGHSLRAGELRAANLSFSELRRGFDLVMRAADLRGQIAERQVIELALRPLDRADADFGRVDSRLSADYFALEVADDDRVDFHSIDRRRSRVNLIARESDPIALARPGEGNLGVRQFYVCDGSLDATRAAFESVIRAFAVNAAIDRGASFEATVQGSVRR